MSAPNPLTAVYNALWTMLEARAEFTANVKVANRIKYVGTARDPDIGATATQDPEVRIKPTRFLPHLFRTSNKGSLTVQFEIQIASGDVLLGKVLDVTWAVCLAMSNWAETLKALTWNGEHYVVKCRPIPSQIVSDDPILNRGIRGWTTVWACETELWFSTTNLQLEGT